MKTKGILLFSMVAILSFSTVGQDNDPAIESITEAELRNHIFLASDFLNGREAATPEYEIAAQYVASQFAAAGVEPAITDEDGNLSYFQGVPFARTTFSEDVSWDLAIDNENAICSAVTIYSQVSSSVAYLYGGLSAFASPATRRSHHFTDQRRWIWRRVARHS